ncbi:MAG TPA: carboxypeptidase-like regulatory domain-containing protein [Gemmatimonadota bacterium]|nr:carboxypeptidase-like regulatory domain-containing protein [Gemmatimonadota bacterium]
MPSSSRPTRLRAPARAALFALVVALGCARGGGPAEPDPTSTDPGRITGTVVRASDGTPLPTAQVRAIPGSHEATIDPAGGFVLTLPSPGEPVRYTVIASHPLLGETRVEVTLGPERPTATVELRLGTAAPEDPADPPPAPTLEVQAGVEVGVIPCVEIGEPLTYTAAVRNSGSEAVEDVTLAGELTPPELFQRRLAPGDVVVDRARFPDARVELDADGFTFTVELGRLEPSEDPVPVYSVSLPSAANLGIWCHRVMADGGRVEDMACFATQLAIHIDTANEDGVLDAAGAFDPAPEEFRVGDGGASRPDALVYRVRLTNRMCTLRGVQLVGRLAPAEILAYRGPLEAVPHRGVVTGSDSGYTWELGDLAPDESAELLFRVEALAPGRGTHRIEISWEGLPRPLVLHEESTDVVP